MNAVPSEPAPIMTCCRYPGDIQSGNHRANLIDFGRKLDGDEDIHCLDSNPETDITPDVLDFRAGDYLIQKRRYSAFYGTVLEILLRGLKVDTLILTGGRMRYDLSRRHVLP